MLSAAVRISQPSLSHAIVQLEQELGVPLFEKNGRNVGLTQFGEVFLKQVRQSLEILDGSVDYLHRIAAGNGVVRLGLLRALGVEYYPLEFYTAWLNAMPDRIPSAMLFEGIRSFDAYTAQQYPASRVPKKAKLLMIQEDGLLVVREMYARGFAFCPLDRSIADAEKYKIINGKIMPPLSMFPEAKA